MIAGESEHVDADFSLPGEQRDLPRPKPKPSAPEPAPLPLSHSLGIVAFAFVLSRAIVFAIWFGVLQYPTAFGVNGYRHPGVRRGWRFWALFPVGVVTTIVTFPLAMLLSLGDLEEEANNHLMVLRRPAV